MFFLLVVVLIAVKYGRAPSAYSAVLGVIMFDVFFVPPRFSFAVSDFQYVVTFIVMLVVGLITGQLTASLRYQARVAASREARSRLLYEFSRELSGALQVEQVVTTTTTMLEPTFRAQIALLLPSADDRLATATPASFPDLDMALAQWCFDKNAVGGYATDTLPTNPFRYLPLKAPMRVRGVLAVRPDRASLLLVPEQVHQLETYAVLIAIALERIHYVEVAQGALINIESEALRNNLLSAISHDLRTPLTAMVGLADSMAVETNPKRGAEIAAILAEDARRMATLVENLLDMARLQSGGVRLKREWVPIEEVVGGAIQSLRTRLGDRAVRVVLPPDLPLVEIDAVLIERVIANLLDNALKYSPVDGAIEIVAGVVAGMEPMLRVDVLDHGAGIPEGKESEIFEKFARGANESATPGVGLGLAICRAIIHAHSGQISAANRADGGACVTFSLPIGHPPPVDLSGDE
jgi:two-component system sensor histidine kinase KdpD